MPTPDRWPEVRRCVAEALELEGTAREDYMQNLRDRDTALASAVEELLDAPEAATIEPAQDRAEHTGLYRMLQKGSRLGHYTLIDILGEGGFGVVWRAEQREPVRREVAVKVIKPGMDSAAVIARFEQERQTLAVMDHPFVARVFDAGMTPPESEHPGLPYFVMELVRGEPITDYCDHARLDIADRLHLFIKVCEAVQHAHTKAVIHRDLKPSNVLVSLQGDEPSPKVIDFGVAKALSGSSPGATFFTEAGSLVGTPDYMSPEQASGGLTDVDIRSDVYSLGVMLYELLTGSRPFDLRRASMFEIQRVIREDDPPRPSTKLLKREQALAEPGSSSEAGEVATHRWTNSRATMRALRTDLDWVTMHCLEKDRARRYDSVGALAQDLRRYLHDEPVSAGPPSVSYKTRKFVKRHRAGVGAVCAVALTLVGTMAAVSAGLVREGTLRRRAETERDTADATTAFLRDTFTALQPAVARGRDTPMLREILGRARRNIETAFSDQPVVAGRLRSTLGETYQALGDFDEAERQFKSALSLLRESEGTLHRDTLIAMNNLAVSYHNQGRFGEAEALHRESLTLHREALGEADPDTLTAQINLATLRRDQNDTDEAERLFKEVSELVTRQDQLVGWHALTGLAALAKDRGEVVSAIEMYEEVYERCLSFNGEDHPETMISLSNLANALVLTERWEEAPSLLRGAVDRSERVLGLEHADTLIAHNNLALVLQDIGELAEARLSFERVLKTAPRVLGDTHPLTLKARVNVAGLYQRTGELEAATAILIPTVDQLSSTLGETDPHTLYARMSLGVILGEQRRHVEAEPHLKMVYDTHQELNGPDDPETMLAKAEYAACLRDLERFDEAAPLFLDVLDRQRESLDEDPGGVLITSYQYAGLLIKAERWDEALSESQWLVERIDTLLPGGHPIRLLGHYRLGAALTGLKRFDAAQDGLFESMRRLDAVTDISPAWKGYVTQAIVDLYEQWGKPDEAEAWRSQLPGASREE
jgi:serine/threonine protein kinase/Flp pilus assembly protein TadD